MRVLVVEDEQLLADAIAAGLRRHAMAVDVAYDGDAALERAAVNDYDVVVLDRDLPKISGDVVCARLAESGVGARILMVTAATAVGERVAGLQLGADDYLTKPFNPRELVARVKAILRRGERFALTVDDAPVRIGAVEIDTAGREFKISGETVDLRTQEFELLLTFARHKGIVLTREKLLQLAWGYDFYGQTRTVDVHVGQLRKKLAGSGLAIDTVTGVGYKLVEG